MSPKKFILLQLENSLREYGDPVAWAFSDENLTAVELSGKCDPVPVLQVMVVFASSGEDQCVRFDATNHLLDGMRFYRSILEQLDVDMNFDIEAQIPSELRHLLPTQPELIGRP